MTVTASTMVISRSGPLSRTFVWHDRKHSFEVETKHIPHMLGIYLRSVLATLRSDKLLLHLLESLYKYVASIANAGGGRTDMGPRFLKMGRAVRYRRQDVDDYERQALVESHEHEQAGKAAS